MVLNFQGALVSERSFPLKAGGEGHQLVFSTGGELVTIASDVLLPSDELLKDKDYSLELGVRNMKSGSMLYVKRVSTVPTKANVKV